MRHLPAKGKPHLGGIAALLSTEDERLDITYRKKIQKQRQDQYQPQVRVHPNTAHNDSINSPDILFATGTQFNKLEESPQGSFDRDIDMLLGDREGISPVLRPDFDQGTFLQSYDDLADFDVTFIAARIAFAKWFSCNSFEWRNTYQTLFPYCRFFDSGWSVLLLWLMKFTDPDFH